MLQPPTHQPARSPLLIYGAAKWEFTRKAGLGCRMSSLNTQIVFAILQSCARVEFYRTMWERVVWWLRAHMEHNHRGYTTFYVLLRHCLLSIAPYGESRFNIVSCHIWICTRLVVAVVWSNMQTGQTIQRRQSAYHLNCMVTSYLCLQTTRALELETGWCWKWLCWK